MMTTTGSTATTARRHDRMIAAAGSLLFHVILLLIVVGAMMSRGVEVEERYLVEDEEPTEPVLFQEVVDFVVGGSYVEAIEIPEPEVEPQLAEGMQPSQSVPEAPDAAEVEEQRRREIADRVKFGTSSTVEQEGDGGNSGQTIPTASNVNATTMGLEGFATEGFPCPTGFGRTGTIAISVTVDATGKVIAAAFNAARGNGDIKNDPNAVRACEQAALSSHFTPLESTQKGASGVIYYHFRK